MKYIMHTNASFYTLVVEGQNIIVTCLLCYNVLLKQLSTCSISSHWTAFCIQSVPATVLRLPVYASGKFQGLSVPSAIVPSTYTGSSKPVQFAYSASCIGYSVSFLLLKTIVKLHYQKLLINIYHYKPIQM